MGDIEFYFKSSHNFVCPRMCVCMFVVLRAKGSSEPNSSSIFRDYIGDLVCFFIRVFSLRTPNPSSCPLCFRSVDGTHNYNVFCLLFTWGKFRGLPFLILMF